MRAVHKGRRKTNYFFKCVGCSKINCNKYWSDKFNPTVIKPKCKYCWGELRLARKDEIRDLPSFRGKFRGKKQAKQRYGEYLKSHLWKTIRERVLLRDNNECQVCKKPATVVHHKSYDDSVIDGNRDCELISLCNSCHREIEFKDGKKVSLKFANKRLLELMSHLKP